MSWPRRNPQNKRNATRGPCNAGHSHDSQAEARYCDLLHLEMRSRENKAAPAHERIVDIETHRSVSLSNAIKRKCGPDFKIDEINWKVDFTLTFADGHREWREVKGMSDAEFRLKRKLFDAFHEDAPVRVFTQRGTRWRET